MKQNRFRFLSFALAGLVLLGAVSCQDDFTEKDALKAQQEIGLAIYVVNYSTTDRAPLANAKVVVSQSGVTQEVTTDETGVAKFPTIEIGEYVYTITADNFVTVKGLEEIYIDNFRQGQVTALIGLYSTSDASMATIKGNITIDTDVTNFTREFPSVTVYADIELSGIGTRTFTGKTDASGNYSIKVPVDANGSYISIRYPEFSADQTIALNRYAEEVAFPATLPRVEKINTFFSTSTSFNGNYDFYEGNVRSLFAVVDAPPADGTQAIVSNVNTNSIGEITSVSFSNGGNYTGDADGKVNITITSLDGGTGGSIVVTLNGASSVSTAYATPANVVLTKGSGYPKNSDNTTLNKITYRLPTSRSYAQNVHPGDEVVANADYGTGVYRPKSVNTG
ncbi:MAG TPA: carboxypeptidase-like regulatory domain-containing protein, partial [Cyclobacteriaceae bacterium]